jgi:4-carboxymuconolactone decarboxylase
MRYTKQLLATVLGVALAGIAGTGLFLASQRALSAQEPGPTVEALRMAMASLPKGRFARPASYDAATPEQQTYARGILSGPRNALSAPTAAMMASPALGELTQRTMAYARFAGNEGAARVPPPLNELAILMAARSWSSEYVWNAHAQYAVRMGLAADVVESIRAGQRPAKMEPDVAAIYRLLSELMDTRRVSDGTFQAARAALGGDRQLIDLVGTFAIYSMTAILTVVDDSVVAENYRPQLPPLDRPAARP